MSGGYYIGDEEYEHALQEKKNRKKIKENQKQRRTPRERTLARLEGKKKEEIIKRTRHRTHLVLKKLCRSGTKESVAQATQQKFESQLSKNHLE